jgi:hypothetical protein
MQGKWVTRTSIPQTFQKLRGICHERKVHVCYIGDQLYNCLPFPLSRENLIADWPVTFFISIVAVIGECHRHQTRLTANNL